MTDDPNFIPPDPDEPIPQPPAGGGATDAGLGGVLVTDTDEIDAAIERLAAALADVTVELTAGMAGAPTWSQCYKLAKSQLAKWAPGRRGENINNYTHWYYGSWSVSAAFCFIFVSWVLAHAIDKTSPTVAEQNAGLQLIGGKKAYVPYIRNISGYHAGHSGMKVGAIVAVGGFEHIGFCVGIGSSTFQLLSGNSTDGSSDDAVTIKTYSLSAANGYVNLKYGTTTSEEDPLIGLKKGDKGEAVTGLQVLLTYAGQEKALGKSGVDGEYGDSTAEALRLARKSVGSEAKAGYGDKVTGWAYAQLMCAVARNQGHA
jgi:hypothetical protein